MLGFAKFALTALLRWKHSWMLIRLNGLVLGYTPFLFRMLVLLYLFWSIVQLYGSALVMKFWAPWSLSLLHYRLFWRFWLSRIIESWPGSSYFSSQCSSGLPLFSGSTGRPFCARRTSVFASRWYGGYTSWFFIWFVVICVLMWRCDDVTNPFNDIDKKIRVPDSFLQSAVTHKRQHYANRCSAAGKYIFHDIMLCIADKVKLNLAIIFILNLVS